MEETPNAGRIAVPMAGKEWKEGSFVTFIKHKKCDG